MKELDFEVPVGRRRDRPDEVEYLFWVGCAGALEDRAKKTTKAFAELLHIAGVKFAILGAGETCSGDSARRLGNEFLFQQLGQENVETLNAVFEERPAGRRKIVATCPHCFNTIATSTRSSAATTRSSTTPSCSATWSTRASCIPVTPVDGKITYHDPCYLGRHNKVYTPAARDHRHRARACRTQEMHRHKERGFCCGAGGARMWMEERIGKRINNERIDEALALNPDIVSTACPFCLVMLHRLGQRQEEGRRGQGARRGRGRQPDPAPLDGHGRRARHRVRPGGRARWTTTRPAPARRPRSTTDAGPRAGSPLRGAAPARHQGMMEP